MVRRHEFSIDGDHFEAVDVDVERVSLVATMVAGADLDPPLLNVIEVSNDGYLFLVVNGVVDEIVASGDQIDHGGRRAHELDHPNTFDLFGLDQRIEPARYRQLRW